MRSPNQLCPPAPGLNITPLIDIVFLLIIFFLVSSQWVQQESAIELSLPTARSAELNEPDASRKEVISIVSPEEMYLRNRPITLAEIQEYLRTKREQGKQDLEVVIRTNREVPSKTIKQVLFACAKSGVWNITYATVPE